MYLTEIVPFILATAIGLTMGLIGAGGGILAVPILVYFFHVKPILATGYSLLIVGSTALIGSAGYWYKGNVKIRDVMEFLVPSIIMMLITRRIILPLIPDPIISYNYIFISKDSFIMTLFAFILIFSGWLMLKSVTHEPKPSTKKPTPDEMMKRIAGSSIIGFITGMTGAGGGFLIIPILIALFGLTMKESIGTSLPIIAINSLSGFSMDVLAGIRIDWSLITTFLSCTILGIFLGTWLGQWIDGSQLKKIFAVFLVLIAFTILGLELISLT